MLAYADMMQILTCDKVDAMQSLTRVEQFYNNAYGHVQFMFYVLLALIGFGIALVGIIVPYWRQRSLRRYIDELMEAYKEKLNEGVKTAHRELNHHSAMHWHGMAATAAKTGTWDLAVRFLCYAIDGAIAAEWEADDHRWH